MSLAELSGSLELEQTIIENQVLAEAREKLAVAVSSSRGNDGLFDAVVPDYLNALQKLWFERSAETRYEAAQCLPRLIKMEMDLLFGSVEPIEEISQRVAVYQNDATAEQLLKEGISHYPRSATMVFLDMLDEYRS